MGPKAKGPRFQAVLEHFLWSSRPMSTVKSTGNHGPEA